MLSYLKDGQTPTSKPNAASEPAGTASENEPTVSGPQDYLTVSGHGRKLRQSTILLLVLFGVGVLGVLFMIKKTTPAQAAAASDDQAKLDAAIAQLTGMQTEVNTQMNSVVGRFYQQNAIGQVGVDELKKNPFKLEKGSGLIGDGEDKQLLEDRIRRATAGLQLWSITSTPRGLCCMVNDKVLYVGDQINELTVKNITDKIVVLEQNGVITELKMDE